MRYQYGVVVAIFITSFFMDISIAYSGPKINDRKKQIKELEKAMQNKFDLRMLQESSLDNCIKFGLKHNPELKSAFYEWKASFKKISQKFSLPDPQLTFTDYIEGVETRVGPQRRSVSLKQKFPLPDKLWIQKSKAFKASESAYYNFEQKKLNVIYQITDAYYEYAYLDKAILLTEENIKLLKNFESVAQVKYKSALTKNQDLLKVQVELGKLENGLYSLKDLRDPLVARLNALLNLPANNPLAWPDESLENTIMEDRYQEVDVLYDVLGEKNLEVLALLQNVEKNKDTLKLAKRKFFPDLTLGVTQIDTGNALNSSTVDSGKDPLMVMFSVNVPIWVNSINAGISSARASLEASESLLENKKNELFSRLALVHYKLRDSLRQSQMYKDALLPKAVQTLHATKSGYEGGGVDFLSLIDSQRMLLNFQLAYYRHNANFYQRLSELKSLLGEVKNYKEWER